MSMCLFWVTMDFLGRQLGIALAGSPVQSQAAATSQQHTPIVQSSQKKQERRPIKIVII